MCVCVGVRACVRVCVESLSHTYLQWQVARCSLAFGLSKHEDFTDVSHDLGVGVASPGHSLLVHMYNDSQLIITLVANSKLATPKGEGERGWHWTRTFSVVRRISGVCHVSHTHSHTLTHTPSHSHTQLPLSDMGLVLSALTSASHSVKIAKEMAVAISNNKVRNGSTKHSVNGECRQC